MENLTKGYEGTYDARSNSNYRNRGIRYRYNCPHNRYLHEEEKIGIKKAAAPTKVSCFLISISN